MQCIENWKLIKIIHKCYIKEQFYSIIDKKNLFIKTVNHVRGIPVKYLPHGDSRFVKRGPPTEVINSNSTIKLSFLQHPPCIEFLYFEVPPWNRYFTGIKALTVASQTFICFQDIIHAILLSFMLGLFQN